MIIAVHRSCMYFHIIYLHRFDVCFENYDKKKKKIHTKVQIFKIITHLCDTSFNTVNIQYYLYTSTKLVNIEISGIHQYFYREQTMSTISQFIFIKHTYNNTVYIQVKHQVPSCV